MEEKLSPDNRPAKPSHVLTAIPPAVIGLGIASLLTDLSSEMIYPLLPAFLTTTLGASPVALGLIEGIAETTASLLKIFSGLITDRMRKRKPFVLAGYGLSGIARPLICLAFSWPWVLFLRFTDRVGKGLRTSPRDALIADVTPTQHHGAAYGLHRAMDHAGAVLGPLVAMALLAAGISTRHVIAFAAIPGVAVMAVLLAAVKEPLHAVNTSGQTNLSFIGLWKSSGPGFRSLMISLLIFNLGNSTDAFLLLRLGTAGMSPTVLAMLWAALHVVKMTLSWIGGRAADRLGPRITISMGWFVYAGVYVAFALIHSTTILIMVFLIYGIYHGLSEPSEKALVAASAPPALKGAAFAFYHGVIGLAALPASVIFGGMWTRFGSGAAFGLGAALSTSATVCIITSGTLPLKVKRSL